MTAPMPETMSPREKVAQIIKEKVSGPHFTDPSHFVAMEHDRFIAADAILTALASGSGDHAELARLAAEANQPMPAKRRAGWWRRKARFEAAFTPSVCSALLAENAALRAELDMANELAFTVYPENGASVTWQEMFEEQRSIAASSSHRATEAERKLAEAVGIASKLLAAISWLDYPFIDNNTSEDELRSRVGFMMKDAEQPRAMLSKEAERG